jgi:crotonobetainyl-CoA:carnitine CoA-transferase CaiB-like acyl-CoA transferase
MSTLLEGLKIIELSTHVAVPKAARIMADWGADVIKIETPKGEGWRTMGQTWALPCSDDNNPLFQSENANKKSIAINLKSEEGKNVLFKLLENADVFMTNTRLKSLKKLGLDYEAIASKFPKLIYAHFSGFGDEGPEKDRPGFDVTSFWARSGALVEWGLDGSIPNKPHPGFGDGASASALLAGIMAALYKRTQTGKGDKVKSSLFGTALWYNSTGVLMGQPAYGHNYPKNRFNQVSPFAILYQTKDRDWILTSLPDYNIKKDQIFDMLGLEKLKGNPRFATLEACRQDGNMKEIVELVAESFSQTDTKTILEGFTKLGVVHEKLAHPRDLYTDPQAWANGYLHELELENGDKVVLPNSPVKFNSMEPPEFNLAPQLGADTISILKELGYADEEIETMKNNNFVKAK